MLKKEVKKDPPAFSDIHEKENVLDILLKAKKALKEKDILTLKDLSNRTVHSASIYQDTDSITIAVLIYALAKTVERTKYQTYREWPFFEKNFLENIDKAIADLGNNLLEPFRQDLLQIRNAIDKISGHFHIYIEEVFRKAMINKASRLYEHGISLAQTASLLGITQFELAEYAGKTGISDVDLSITLDIKTRIKNALELFE